MRKIRRRSRASQVVSAGAEKIGGNARLSLAPQNSRQVVSMAWSGRESFEGLKDTLVVIPGMQLAIGLLQPERIRIFNCACQNLPNGASRNNSCDDTVSVFDI